MRKLSRSILPGNQILACALSVLASALIMWGQVETGQITGTVTDPSGAVVANATVKAVNSATGAERDTVSSGSGLYVLPNLEPSAYDVTVSAAGFATTKQRIVLAVGQRLGNDFKLQVGATATTIEVREAEVAVNTETQSLSSTIDSKQVIELPSLTRDPYDFVATMPNVSDADPSQRGTNYAINGMRSASTNVLLDGVANNDEFTARVGQQVPIDSVQEYSVTSSDFTAEVGRASGGVVNVVTKSGTNTFHGTAYEFNRVSSLSANTFYNNANGIAQGIYDRNQFGYSVGGPVIKNKLFFFQNTEWTRIRSAAPQVAMVPTSQFIAASAAPTQAFFAAYGKLRPDLVTLQTFTKAQLHPCGSTLTDACNSLAANFPMFNLVQYNTAADAGGGNPQNTYDIVGNVDYVLNDKTSISAKYALYSENDFPGTVDTSPYAGFETGQLFFDNHLTVSATHTFSPTLISQTRLSYNRLTNVQPLAAQPVAPTLYMSATTQTVLAGQNVALPGYSPYTPGNSIPFGGPQNFGVLTHDMTKVKGKHSIRFGGQFTYIQDDRTFGAYEEAVEALGTGVGNALDNFLAGQLHEFEAAVNPQGQFPGGTVNLPVGPPNFSRSNRYKESALYVQDSWKVRPRMTVNLGLRWEYYGVQHNNKSTLDANFYPGAGSTLPQQIASGVVDTVPNSPNKTLWNPTYRDFAPRLGFAYDVFGDGKTSIRGGYGIGYERNFGNVTFNLFENPPNFGVLALVAGTDLPTIPISTSNAGPLAGNSGSKTVPPVTLRAVNPNIKTAYAHTYSVALEHQFGTNVIWSESYTGSTGENLYSIDQYNSPGEGNAYNNVPCTPGTFGNPGTCTARINSQYSYINDRTNGGFSNYNALISRIVTKNVWKTGITLDASYTWSHAIDNLSGTFSDGAQADYQLGFMEAFQPALDKGNSDFDAHHRIAISGIWELPFFKGSSLRDRVLGGWEFAPIFTARTGSPFTLYDCSNAYPYCPRAETAGALPKMGVTNVPTPGVPDNFQYYTFPTALTSQVGVWYNPKVGISDFGPFPSNILGRNTIFSPGVWNVNMGVYKNTRINEKFSLQLRLEMYDAFNHANFTVNVADVDVSAFKAVDGGFGQNPQPGTTVINYPSRNVQLGAKLIF